MTIGWVNEQGGPPNESFPEATRAAQATVKFINSQLGGIGYTIRIEYVFYMFFALCVLSIIAVLAGERLRAASRPVAALRTEQAARAVFLVAMLAVAAAAFAAWS